MRRISLLVVAAALISAATPSRAALNVFACEPEWGSLATALGGDRVNVFVATTGLQDPHMIQARPALIARLRRADLSVCTGAELEIGWMPVLLRSAANGKIQPGAPGYFAAAEQIALKEVPTRLDRSMGDVHAAGNPHIQTDPENILAIAPALTARLIQIDPAGTATYQRLGDAFVAKLKSDMARWQAAAAPLRGKPVVVYHKNWVYLFGWLGLKEVGAIEPKPGVPPSSGYLAELLTALPPRHPAMIIRAAYEDPRASEFVGGKLGLPVVALPFTVGGNDAAKDLFGLYDDTVRRLVAALGGRNG